jgi:hypothetical protein
MTRPDNARGWLILAIIATVVCTFVPFGRFLLYPFALFETFVHETMHAFAAVATGGEVVGMNVNWNTSGLTQTRGGWNIVISTAGYLGSLVVGLGLLLAGRREERSPVALMVLGGLTLVATAVFAGYGSKLIPLIGFGLGASLVTWGSMQTGADTGDKRTWAGGVVILATLGYLTITGGALTWAVGLLIGLGAIAVGGWAPKWVSQATLIFLATQNVLASLEGLKVLFDLSVTSGGHSDAVNMANMTGIPAAFWALLWGVVGVVVTGAAMWLFVRDAREA